MAGTKPPSSTYLPFGVPVPVLVLVPQGKLQWIMILNFLVGHFLTDALQRDTAVTTPPNQAGGSARGMGQAGEQVYGAFSGPWKASSLRLRAGPLGTLRRGGRPLVCKKFSEQSFPPIHPVRSVGSVNCVLSNVSFVFFAMEMLSLITDCGASYRARLHCVTLTLIA